MTTESGSGSLLEVCGLKKHFSQSESLLDRIVGETGVVKAVDGVDLTINEGETVAIVGESGCGKSTLAETIINLNHPTDGTVTYRGNEISGLSKRKMRPYRRHIQMIFQDPLASMNPRKTVSEILTAPLEIHDIGSSPSNRREIIVDSLERVGLSEAQLNRYPNQFSGGQQQRIAIARAITLEPDLLVADEPVSALDVSVQAQILNLLDSLKKDLNLSIMFIAHDLSVVRHISDRVAVMYLGEIVEQAETEELFGNPQHPYTKSLLSAVPRIQTANRPDRITLEGAVPSPLDPPEGCRFNTRCPVVIPPNSWSGTQEEFKAAYTFRTRVLNDEINPGTLREYLQSENESLDEAEIVEYLIGQTLPIEIQSLPSDAADAIRTAAEYLVEENREAAAEVVRETFPSPCEQHQPRSVEMNSGHKALCHRVDPEKATELEFVTRDEKDSKPI